MNDRLRDALRRKIARHNKFIRLYAVWSGFLVIGMWAGIYFVGRWSVIFFRTVTQGVDAELPPASGSFFLAVVAVWLAAGWLDQIRQPTYLRSNDRGIVEVFLEFILFPPRVTFSAVRQLSQRVSLQEPEIDMAANLLERVGRAGKLPLAAVPEFTPMEVPYDRLVDALCSLELIYRRNIKDEEYLIISDPERLAAFL